jgi:hypothetical protein
MRSMVPPAARPLGDGTTILIAYTTKTKRTQQNLGESII